eukprot:TRINITY_DN9334_c0_g1_i1.p1 TRINITY_DN9334_c0_g1~~TRINITY_DN9334_c0_g1_i1.p1  ORF type:complete len:602 (+),score=130.85 TRINITY_DN9334_c0_g1_i1:257-1807(+)
MVGYDKPIYMTAPTKAICPILLEDYRKITVERKGEDQRNFFTRDDIKRCMSKVVTVDLHQTMEVMEGVEIKAYYAGHVLGAAMFYVKVGNESVVYTGDYNMTPDRHLGAAWIDQCNPDVIITESTYATTIRESKRCRERDFLNKVVRCVANGGKVLIPVFALGRAQELCILLETHWARNNLSVPIYFSTGLTARANEYYKLFITWTNQKIKDTFVERNMFDFKHIRPFDRSYLDLEGPQVLFATPGMLHAGTSLQAFTRWCDNPKNMVILPGYCVAGTVGAKVIAGHKEIQIDVNTRVNVRMAVEHLSFSAHADAKGIMQLIKQSGAKNVVLVHGEKQKMAFLAERVKSELGLECFFPPNGHAIEIATTNPVPIRVSRSFLARVPSYDSSSSSRADFTHASVRIKGIVVKDKEQQLKLVTHDEAKAEHGIQAHRLRQATSLPQVTVTVDQLKQALLEVAKDRALGLDRAEVMETDTDLRFRSLHACKLQSSGTKLSWEARDEDIARALVQQLTSLA